MKLRKKTLVAKTQVSKSGILLLAKQKGCTSFSSLSAVKKSLETSKVGHTGTLDSFADGLLVVLTGGMTRLVPHITSFDKTYLAVFEFGTETDTLDPTGNIVGTGPVPSRKQIEDVLPEFTGEIFQAPPLFSALHINGKRASDIARSGSSVKMPERKITVHSIKLLEWQDRYALFEISCSKGTYIRSLARDIARRCGTVAHVTALRRTKVGPFSLENAALYSLLDEFSIESGIKENALNSVNQNLTVKNDGICGEIKKSLLPMNIQLAEYCGFVPAILTQAYIQDFINGRKLKNHAFLYKTVPPENCEFAVFYPDLTFAGVVKKQKRKLSYGFVLSYNNPIRIFSWEQIFYGKFDKSFLQKGTALSIGSFDGTHIGHDAIFDSILQRKEFARGIVTFRHSTRVAKSGDDYKGDVSTLSQRIDFFIQKGFDFVIVIDFSDDFIKISGEEFLSILKNNCNLKYLVEGIDFRCGHKGAMDVDALKKFCAAGGIDFDVISFVDYLGKKVSSSRIRQDVLNKEFSAINIMLHKPFEIDCSGFEWNIDTQQFQTVFSAQKKGMQVFPPDGEYKVSVKMVISGSEEISVTKPAICKLESGLLRVLVSDGSCGAFVRSIQFC